MSYLKRYWLPILIIILVFAGTASVYVFKLNTSKEQAQITQTQATDEQSESFSFLAFGDSGTGSSEQRRLRDQMLKHDINLIIHTGDLAYQSGTHQEIKNNVLDVYDELFAEVDFYPSLGNHDYLTENAQPYIDTFELPGNERYYSFNQGNALFIALDTNKPLDQNPAQMVDWLEATLENRSENVLWTVVYFHHPAYSAGQHGSDSRVQGNIVPILERYNVDLVFSGHEHNYQRTCEIEESKCVDEGVTYIITGGGGAPLHQTGEPEWFTQKQESIHHFVKGIVGSCRLSIEVVDIDDQIRDQFSLSKCD